MEKRWDREYPSRPRPTESSPPAPSRARVGILVAVVFFALSLLPSLLPRPALFQGVVSGASVAIGYGFGVSLQWVWAYLSLPTAKSGAVLARAAEDLAVAGLAVLTFLAVWRQVGWQNDTRELFGMGPVSPASWVIIIVVTSAVAALLIIIGRTLRKVFRLLAELLNKVMPIRLARVLGALVLVVVLSFLINGALVNAFFSAASSAFSSRDNITERGVTKPQVAERSGSDASLVEWDTLGRMGRSFVGTGPTVADLEAFTGDGAASRDNGAMQPIRVYAGLESADTIQGRADLILDELRRTNAFDREVLVVATTTTGTGFLEPNAMNSL